MDRENRVNYFRQVITSILREYARLCDGQPEGVDVVAICDETTDSYTVVNVGWHKDRRLSLTSVLMRIVNDNIWIEEENTMYQFVEKLLDEGIQKEEIVLALKPPSLRPYTEFAVA